MLSGLLAAVLAWLINKLTVEKLGTVAIFSFVPLTEELLKTAFAFLLDSSILYTHLTFGLAEAIFDVLRPGLGQAPAGLMSLLSHGLYGWLTVKIFLWSGSIWLALAVTITLHSLWNAGVIFLPTWKRR